MEQSIPATPGCFVIQEVIAWDFETELLDRGKLAPPVVCLATCDSSLEPKLYHWTEAEPIVRNILENHNSVLQNGAFDLGCVCSNWPHLTPLVFKAYREGRILDTMLNERLIHIARGILDGEFNHQGVYQKYFYNLEALALRYDLGQLEKDKFRLRYGEVRHLPLDRWHEVFGDEVQGAYDYPKRDALTTYQVFVKQSYYEDFLVDAAAQAKAHFALHLQSCRGMITDPVACDDFIAETQQEIDKARALLQTEGIVRENGTKDTKKAKARMEAVCNELGMPIKKTAGKGISLNAEATRDTGDDVLMAYSLFTSASTALDRAKLLKEGSRGLPLQTSYVTPLETGRVSSRSPSDPLVGANFTNLPRKEGLRGCFIPRPGFVYCSIDGNMAELVGVAQIHHWVLGGSTLGAALRENKDVHCMLGADMLRCSYDEILANKKHGKYKKERQNAKYGNFGFWGGMGLKKFVMTTNATIAERENKIDLGTAHRIKSAWTNTWAPESTEYFIWVNKLLGEGQATIRQFISGRVRANIDYCTTANTFFQGLVADAFKAALFEITQECYCDRSSPLYGSRPVLFLHDEIFLELREDQAHEAAFRARDLLLEVCNNTYFPDVPLTAEPAIMKRWYKSAEPVYQNGRLVCWEPEPKKEAA